MLLNRPERWKKNEKNGLIGVGVSEIEKILF